MEAKCIWGIYLTEDGKIAVGLDEAVVESMMEDDTIHVLISVLDIEMKKLATRFMEKRGANFQRNDNQTKPN